MHPIICHIFGLTVPAYGFFMTLANLAGIFTVVWRVNAAGKPLGAIVDSIFLVLFFGVGGARAGYVATNWQEFQGHISHIFFFWQGGLSVLAGLASAFLAFALFLRWRQTPVLETADLLLPAVPLAIGTIRLGCFGAGCCYGTPTRLPWGVHFHSGSLVPAPLLEQALHPTQLYEALLMFSLVPLLLWASERKIFRPGVLFTFFVFLYAAFRFGNDFLRGDSKRGALGLAWLSPTQALALLLLASTPILFWQAMKKRPETLPQLE